jgi:hypothetical protein
MKLYHNGKLVEAPTSKRPFKPWLEPSIEVHPDLKTIWKEGQEVEEGKDFVIEPIQDEEEWKNGRTQVTRTAVPVKEESEDVLTIGKLQAETNDYMNGRAEAQFWGTNAAEVRKGAYVLGFREAIEYLVEHFQITRKQQ